MVRKRRTPIPSDGESSKSIETSGGNGSDPVVQQHPPERAPPPSQQGVGRGSRDQGEGRPVTQSQQGRLGGNGGRGYGRGRGGSQPHGEMALPQYADPASGSQSRNTQLQGRPPQERGDPILESVGRSRGGGSVAVGHDGGSSSSGSASKSLIPELYQATPAPYQASPSAITQQIQNLSVQSVGASVTAVQPVGSSSGSLRFPRRPGKGIAGVKCLIKANHFLVTLRDKDLYHYDVSISPEVTSWGRNRVLLKQLVELYMNSELGGRNPAYDGRKSLYTAGPLPFTSKEFAINLADEDDGTGRLRRESQYRVVINLVARPELHHLELFLKGVQADAPQEVITVLDVVLRQQPASRYTSVGRSFYSPDFGQQSISEGLEIWRGFYQSIRPTQMGLSLNIDMSSTAFIADLPVIDFVTSLLNNREVLGRTLTDSDRLKIKRALRGVKVEVTHRGNMRRKYSISGITSNATRELNFPVDDRGTVKSVVEYFRETYGFVIEQTSWPCLLVGNQKKPQYMPMEVCKIVKGQRYTKRLSDKQITSLRESTGQNPTQRKRDILTMVHHNAYQADPHANEFGIKISKELASVEARILPAPLLKYHDTGSERNCLPQAGQWNMMNKKMVNGGTVNSWACINFARDMTDGNVDRFCSLLGQMCCTSGMVFNLDPICPPHRGRPDQVEKALKILHKNAMTKLKPQGKELDLVIVILPDNNGSLYGDLKRICETDLGVVSQCCLAKHLFQPKKPYLANVALKINVKVGGRNTVLVDALSRRIPRVSDVPTIIFGADVTHPRPGEQSSPSIAAVVASQDWPEVTKYAGLVCAQAPRQEIIDDLYKVKEDPVQGTVTGGMVKELLLSFNTATNKKPERIIFYRDGVSEGQFYQVLYHELEKIREACRSMQPDGKYQPRVTFVVVQKRHRTRLFADENAAFRAADRNGNVLPGTVVDSSICHPTEFDFYLCSHAGIKGTSRPAHYHVLWDDNNFTADELQTLTNNLCYTYARCTRSVSIVPPAYYAHLAAFRARCYMEQDPSEGGQDNLPARGGPVNSRAPVTANAVSVRPLPDIKDKVKRVMFYC